MDRDREKDQALSYAGWTVIHFWGKDILKNPEECIRVIEVVSRVMIGGKPYPMDSHTDYYLKDPDRG